VYTTLRALQYNCVLLAWFAALLCVGGTCEWPVKVMVVLNGCG
jgi:hypothetical protein